MRNYIFVDEGRLQLLVDQLDAPALATNKLVAKLAVSLAGPTLEVAREAERSNESSHLKIDRLLDYLGSAKLLGARPPRMPLYSDDPVDFVLEQTLATKVIVPTDALAASGLQNLVVWVSEPETSTMSIRENKWDFVGTFLYLTERPFDMGQCHTVFSGCSALQMVSNAASGKPLLTKNPSEALGRWSSAHPIDKLVSLGGVVVDERKIECLYRVRYVTDEQCFEYNGSSIRVNDLLGYPIYIAEIF